MTMSVAFTNNNSIDFFLISYSFQGQAFDAPNGLR